MLQLGEEEEVTIWGWLCGAASEWGRKRGGEGERGLWTGPCLRQGEEGLGAEVSQGEGELDFAGRYEPFGNGVNIQN